MISFASVPLLVACVAWVAGPAAVQASTLPSFASDGSTHGETAKPLVRREASASISISERGRNASLTQRRFVIDASAASASASGSAQQLQPMDASAVPASLHQFSEDDSMYERATILGSEERAEAETSAEAAQEPQPIELHGAKCAYQCAKAVYKGSTCPTVFIKNLYSGKCLDINGAPGTSTGLAAQQYACEFKVTNTDQRFTFTEKGYIQSEISGKCIDMPTEGLDAILGNCDSTPARSDQTWDLTVDGKIKHKKTGKCLQMSKSKHDKARAEIVACASHDSQKFELVCAEALSSE